TATIGALRKFAVSMGWQTAKASAARCITAVVRLDNVGLPPHSPSDPRSDPDMSIAQPVLRAEKISKQVSSPEGTLTILAGVDLSIQAGETVAIIGASGAGKSTLLALLAGLDEPSDGRIWLNGSELTALDE